MEADAEIPYLMPNPTHIDFWEILNNSELEKRPMKSKINTFKEVIEINGEVFLPTLDVPI